MPSPLPQLPSNPLGDAPRNPLGRPPAIGSRTGGGRYRVKSPLPRVASRPANQAPSPAQRPTPGQPRQQAPARIIHIHQYREARGETPPPAPAPSAAQQRRTQRMAGLRQRDREYFEGQPADTQDRVSVLMGEMGAVAHRRHHQAGLQEIENMLADAMGRPPRDLKGKGKVRKKKQKASENIHKAAQAAASEENAEYAKRHAEASSPEAQEAVRRARAEAARQQAAMEAEEAEIKRKQSGE